MNLPQTIETDYMQSDFHITSVTVYECIEAEDTILCDTFSDGTQVSHGTAYWYKGDRKNIPFDWTPDSE